MAENLSARGRSYRFARIDGNEGCAGFYRILPKLITTPPPIISGSTIISMKALIVLSLALCVLSAGSNAQQEKKPEDRCCCSTFETGQCLIKVESGVDADLNNIYQKAFRQSSESEVRTSLQKAERAWIAYRDANCNSELATYGLGTMGPNMGALCRIRLTRQRIEEITYIYLPEH